MGRKRKRCREENHVSNRPGKLARRDDTSDTPNDHRVPYKILSSYYKRVTTLRQFLLTQLPLASTGRRKKLLHYETDKFSAFLDRTLIGVLQETSAAVREAQHQEYTQFSQTQLKHTVVDSARAPACHLADLVDFVVWLLFQRSTHATHRPNHILCHGLQRRLALGPKSNEIVPGIAIEHPNENRDVFKRTPWTDVGQMLGLDAESILLSLLLDCGIFTRLENGYDNYYQLSGVPISALELNNPDPGKVSRAVNQIRIPLSKVLYNRPALNASGRPVYGLPQSHVLQTKQEISAEQHISVIARHVFPLQFGLPNIWQPGQDTPNTSLAVQKATNQAHSSTAVRVRRPGWLPQRLRGGAMDIVSRLQKNHQRCSYSQILRYYCPVRPESPLLPVPAVSDRPCGHTTYVPTQPSQRMSDSTTTINLDPITSDATIAEESSFVLLATPTAMVSAFCQSILRRLLPSHTFGNREQGRRNLNIVLRQVEKYLWLRKYECLSLHELAQGIAVNDIPWLQCKKADPSAKTCASDRNKRNELLGEWLYFIFDSLVVPVIRAHFYVTESATQRNRIHYFRHDVWQKLCEPTLTNLQLNTYEVLSNPETRRLNQNHSLGCSHIRMLPKERGLRTITNLKRKVVRLVRGKAVVGPGINTQLAPVFNAFNYERTSHVDMLGSALLCAGDLYPKIRQFRATIPPGTPLYFVKVDVRSCFDSIPHDKLLQVTSQLLQHDAYRMTKQMESRFVDSRASIQIGRPMRRFVGLARPADSRAVCSMTTAQSTAGLRNQVLLSDTGNQQIWATDFLRHLLQNHIKNNIVRVGKRHLRQKVGIPQGSILSTMLCSVFYSAYEDKRLQFLNPTNSLLLRLIDDFLLISTSRQEARGFLEVMSKGDPEFGISISPNKTMTNFDVSIEGQSILMARQIDRFPYCGITINTKTLEIGRDREKRDGLIGNSLTVDTSRKAGVTFQRKILAVLKMQLHHMLLDTSLNSTTQILTTLIGTFTEIAMKLHQYLARFRTVQRPSSCMIKTLIEDLMAVTEQSCRSQLTASGSRQIRRSQIRWAAAVAFTEVLSRKQSLYNPILSWLNPLKQGTQPTIGMKSGTVADMLQICRQDFQGYSY